MICTPSRGSVGAAHKIQLPANRPYIGPVQGLGVDTAVEADLKRGIDCNEPVNPRQNSLTVRV